jgi:phage shock protein PspC (stress-responsive transcriptional regulator)
MNNGYHRSRHGILLGVFKGIAETQGWSVLLTRVIGIIILLCVAKMLGAHHLAKWFVAGFFYLAAAVLMPPPHRELP